MEIGSPRALSVLSINQPTLQLSGYQQQRKNSGTSTLIPDPSCRAAEPDMHRDENARPLSCADPRQSSYISSKALAHLLLDSSRAFATRTLSGEHSADIINKSPVQHPKSPEPIIGKVHGIDSAESHRKFKKLKMKRCQPEREVVAELTGQSQVVDLSLYSSIHACYAREEEEQKRPSRNRK